MYVYVFLFSGVREFSDGQERPILVLSSATLFRDPAIKPPVHYPSQKFLLLFFHFFSIEDLKFAFRVLGILNND